MFFTLITFLKDTPSLNSLELPMEFFVGSVTIPYIYTVLSLYTALLIYYFIRSSRSRHYIPVLFPLWLLERGWGWGFILAHPCHSSERTQRPLNSVVMDFHRT